MAEAAADRFDPYALLAALERRRVAFVVIGSFARVVQGAEETAEGVDVAPSLREDNLERLAAALDDLGVKQSVSGELLAREPVVALETEHGELKLVGLPAGTRRGYDDLRRAAGREPIGKGLRPAVASLGDLARMLAALGRDQDAPRLQALRRLVELDRGRGVER
jgi:hypothetical protein